MISISPQTYSPQAYLDDEETAQERHEYIHGEIRLMPGKPLHTTAYLAAYYFC